MLTEFSDDYITTNACGLMKAKKKNNPNRRMAEDCAGWPE